MRRADHRPELLDGPLDRVLLDGNLRDLARVNRWLGGAELSCWALERLVQRRGTDDRTSIRLLDVGTGAADIPLALLEWSRRRGVILEIEATDVREEVVEAARRRAGGRDAIRVALAPPTAIPYADRSFDVAHASLVLHHLEHEAAVQLLREMARVARRGVVVNDLDRRSLHWLGAFALSRLATRNRYTRHDAPLSVRRAYRPGEVVALAREAGLRTVGMRWGPLRHRYALVLRHAS